MIIAIPLSLSFFITVLSFGSSKCVWNWQNSSRDQEYIDKKFNSLPSTNFCINLNTVVPLSFSPSLSPFQSDISFISNKCLRVDWILQRDQENKDENWIKRNKSTITFLTQQYRSLSLSYSLFLSLFLSFCLSLSLSLISIITVCLFCNSS